MRRRFRELGSVLVLVAVVSLALVTARAQGPTTSSQADQALKTSWGEPNFQGIWGIELQVPLQRPAKFKDREFFTDAEIAELDKDRAAKPFGFGDKRAERGTERDLAGAYDSRVFLQHRKSGRRTSLIVDPPDGRLPPFTP